MIELIVTTYGLGCWLIFKKFRLVPVTTYTVCTAILGGIVMLFGLMIMLSFCHPVSHDGRFYAAVVQVTPQVRGRVTDVPVAQNEQLKAGDTLFTIDPTPFRLEVERLEARLAGMNAQVAQLDARFASAQAAASAARSNLEVSESDFDRQARIALETSRSQIQQVQSRLNLAKENLDRTRKLIPSGTATREELDEDETRVEALQAELNQAENAQLAAQEQLDSGGARLSSVRDALKQAEANEEEARIARDAESDGQNPEVRQTMAELDRKRWELDQTTVRAPSDGLVTYVSLRPGQMALPFSVNSAMLFVPNERPMLVATFHQNTIAGIQPGHDAEIAFKAYPGQIFAAKVKLIAPISPEGQFIGSGKLQATTAGSVSAGIPVVFEYGDDVAALNLPAGAQASVAVYTHHLHAIALVRKVILRIKSWENYAFFLQGLDGLH